jgi:RNA polymerase subunit RPABC4/transcription elongation factor Spt4
MSTEELTEQAPPTRTCRTCAVEINAASARCPYCGTRQFRYQPILGWRGLLVCLVAVALAVLVTRAVVSASTSVSFASYRSDDLVLLIPSGYTDQLLSSPHGSAIAGFVNPSQADDSETLKATAPAGGTPRSRAFALAGKLRTTPGVELAPVVEVALPGGGRGSAWELLYMLDGADYAVFEYDACDHAVGVTLTLSASKQSLLDELELAVPQSAQPICDGPDFSAIDRADTSVPLRSSS